MADGSGRRYAQVGSDQEAQNQNPHGVGVLVTPNGQTPGEPASGPAVGAHVENGSPPSVKPSVQGGTPDGSAASLLTGGQVYMGADDNLDTGEHDGVDGQYGTQKSANGPSDGGDIAVNWHPGQTTTWLADLMPTMAAVTAG